MIGFGGGVSHDAGDRVTISYIPLGTNLSKILLSLRS
jgi:hypothetical protein